MNGLVVLNLCNKTRHEVQFISVIFLPSISGTTQFKVNSFYSGRRESFRQVSFLDL